MPTSSKPTTRVIGAVVIISIILVALIIAAIWQGTTAMFLSQRSASPTTESGGSAGYAVGMPAMQADVMAPIAPQPGPGATPEDRAAIGPKIIRSGSLTLRVDDAAKRLEELRKIVSDAKGFVDSANVTDNAGVKTASVTVRVPNDQFDAVRIAAKGLASTVFVETENSQDVTAQFVDLNARLTAAQAEEQSYLDILKKSGSIQDTLAVTQQLAQVRTTIEQLQGQMRYMNDQTSYATLSITLTEEAKVEVPTKVWKPLETFNLALRGLVQSLQDLADAFITAGVFILGLLVPVLIGFWIIGWIIWRIVRAFTKK
jgi:hypothetical protein